MPEAKLTKDEELAMTEARKASEALLARSRGAGTLVLDVDKLEPDSKDRILMLVPKTFVLTLDDHRQIRFPAGPVSVPRFSGTHTVKGQTKPQPIADHWYVKAHGVEPYKGPAPGVETQVIEKTVEVMIAPGGKVKGPVKIGDKDVPLKDLVLAAYKKSGLSEDEWNSLASEKRDELIIAEIKAQKAAIEPKSE